MWHVDSCTRYNIVRWQVLLRLQQQQQKSKYHSITHDACTIVQQYGRVQQKSLSTNNARTHHVCTITVQQRSRKKSEDAETSEIQLTLCLTRIERATVPSPTRTAALAIPGERTGVAANLGELGFFKVALP